MTSSPLEERHQRAREAFDDQGDEHDCTSCSRDRCIETATRVKITDEMIQAARGREVRLEPGSLQTLNDDE